jgi:hypothetical protein
MTFRSPTSIVLVVGLAFVVGGCSAAAPSPSGSPSSSSPPSASPAPSNEASPSPSPSPSSAAGGDLLLKVTSEGGFIAPSATLAALPAVVVYTDGRIFTPAAMPAIYPAPLLGAFQVRDVGTAGAAAIEDAIRAAGLDAPAETDPGIVADTGTTVFTAVLDGVTTTARFSSPGGAIGRPDMSGSNPAAAAAFALLERLNDPTDTWGGPGTPQTIYTPAGYRVFVAPGGPAADAQASQSPMAWPLPTPLAEFGTPAVPDRGVAGLRSGVVLGDDAATLAPFLAAANVLTPVTSGGQAYTLFVRPLLPDESAGPCCGR